MNVTFRQIEVFFYAATLGSLSKAAEKVFITQAAASMALKEFESQLGENLFERVGKKLVLNENGRAIIAYCSELIGRADDLEKFFSKEASLLGSLNVGASSTIGNYVLPGYIELFTSNNPSCSINMIVGNTEEIIDKVLNFEVDLGIIEGLCFEPKINIIPWLDDELVIFASSSNSLVKKDYITEKDLCECSWILREQGSGTRRIFEDQLRALSISINISQVLGHTEAVKNAVSKGNGVSCLSRCVLNDLAELGVIKLLDTPCLDLRRKFLVLVHENKFQSRVLQGFLQELGL